MNQSKRNFIKILPLVALGGVAVKVGEHKAKAVEVKQDKRYVIQINNEELTQKDLDGLRATLTNRGFGDFLVVAGPVEIYELEK